MSMNIVIVTYNWPPRNAIGTHRPYAWARYWSEAGAKVTVLTARKQPFDEPLDLHLPSLEGVEVIEVSGKGAVSVLSRLLKPQRLRQVARKIKAWLGRHSAMVSEPRMAWRGAAKAKAVELALKADVVVSTFGPAAAHLIAYDMKMANPNLFWVADYRDLWSQRHTTEIHEDVRETSRILEKGTVGAKADLLSAVSKDMVEQLTDFLGKETLELPNGFDIEENSLRDTFSERPAKPDGPMRIVYTGMIYEGHRDPAPLLDALVALHTEGEVNAGEVTVDFYGARVELAKRLARNPAYAPFIRLMGHVSRDKALEAQRSAGLLLLLESPAPEARGVLTGKLFEYISAGRPILCVGSRPEYEIGNVLTKTGTGRVFGPDEFGQLKGVLRNTLSSGGLYNDYFPDFLEVLKYSRKTQSEYFLESILRKAGGFPK
jgi:glycosyltransferase involved in cell wall biosynthesis